MGNIERTLKKCGFDLYTHVIKWEEFKDLQRAYFKASVIDIEAVTDHAIIGILYKMANKYNLKYIPSGSNTVTEGILPHTWGYNKQDPVNLLQIHRQFGKVKLKTYPLLPRWESILFREIKKISIINFLDYYDYNKEEAKKVVEKELGWVDYGGKHFESIFTRFYQGYILLRKFNIDKRRAHLSTLINSGQMSRNEALEILKKEPYDPIQMKKDRDFVLKKLDFTEDEFEDIMNQDRISHYDYKYQLPFSLEYPKAAKALKKILRKK